MADTAPAKTILLVEDETLIAMNETAILKKHGYNVVTAYTAKKAIEAAASPDIDLILMDIDLGKGKMDGTEAAEVILQARDLPIVFCTSHGEKEYVDKVKGITRYGYVLKNSGEFILKQSIDMAFELFSAQQFYYRDFGNIWKKDHDYLPPGFGDSHCALGWGCAFKGAGH